MTIPLPERGDGSRRRRRADRADGRRHAALVVVGVVGAVAVVLGLFWVVVGLVGRGGGHGTTPTTEAAVPKGGVGRPSLVVLEDSSGAPYGITVLAPRASTIVHVPPGTLVEVPSLGLASLHDAAAAGGISLLQHSLENELGVRFASVAALGPSDVAAVVAGVGPLHVTVDAAVQSHTSTGRVTVVVPAGPQAIDAQDAVVFLSSLGDGTSLDRLVRHQAFWTAYLRALGAKTPAPPLAPVAAALGALARSVPQHVVLPVASVAGTTGDAELYKVVTAQVGPLVHRLFGVRADRIRVQVLNGVGQPGVAQAVEPLLVDAGAELALSGNADRFDHATTQIVYYDDARRGDAETVRAALGVGEIVKSLSGLDVVDVTVVVGADFTAARHGG